MHSHLREIKHAVPIIHPRTSSSIKLILYKFYINIFPIPYKPKKKGKKKAAKAAKAVSDKVKINMGNERTLTKWLAMGMEIGAIGTFVLLMLHSNHDGKSAWGLTTFLVAWAVGFALVLYGVLGYYGRRKAIETGNLDLDPASKYTWVPLAVTVALVSVVVASLLYVGIVGLPGRTTSTIAAEF